MTDQEGGNGERATIRLVAEMVGKVDVKLDGIKALSVSQHADTQRQLDGVTGLPLIVTGLTKTLERHDERIGALEKRDTDTSQWRRNSLPVIAIGAVGLLVAVLNLIPLIFH